MIATAPAKRKTGNLRLLKPRKMSDELKIIDSVVCGSPWADADPDGTLYTIQVGKDPEKTRLAFIQTGIDQPVWVKKGSEKEALDSVKSDITTKPYLFDLKGEESREALCKLFRPKEGLKIIDSKTCGNAWIGITGTLYTIQIGDDEQNTRLAFQQYPSKKCAWVKKGLEEEARKLTKEDPSQQQSLFNSKEYRDTLVALLTKGERACSRPDGPPQAQDNLPRKACG